MNCTMRIIRLRELYYACSTIFFREVRCKTGRVVREAAPYGGVTRGAVRCRRADRGIGPYGGLQGVREKNPPVTASHVQGTGVRIATASVRTGFAMTWFLHGVRYGGTMWASLPTESYHGVRGSAPPTGDRKGRPYGGLQEVRWGEESPSHGFAVTAPFRQGGRGDGLPHQ